MWWKTSSGQDRRIKREGDIISYRMARKGLTERETGELCRLWRGGGGWGLGEGGWGGGDSLGRGINNGMYKGIQVDGARGI